VQYLAKTFEIGTFAEILKHHHSMSYNALYEKELAFQADRRRATVEFIRLISDLWYEDTIELILFRNQLIDRNVSEILNLVEYASEFVEKPISIFDAVEIAREIKDQQFPPSKIDIGKLVYEYHLDNNQHTFPDFVREQLKEAKNANDIQPKDVVLFGFGRIGRLLARELMVRTGKGNLMRLRAIVTRGAINETVLEKRAALLRNDSVHGDFHGTVMADIEKSALIINGTTVYVISANAPEEIDYNDYGISDALLIDNTGAFRDEEGLGRHLKAKGISKVLLTAPGKGVPNM
jgi:glyceraldehyde 3-phosphate dehydrogenase